jgi:hypothetical protein
MSQVFKTPEQQKLLEDTFHYVLKEHAKGVYEIDLDMDFFEELYGHGSKAVAVRIPKGISFVIIPRFSGEEYAVANEERVAKNLPHEIHHIAWMFIVKNGLLSNTETDSEMAKAFSMYRDEVIARMVAGDTPFGYDHLQVDPRRKAQVQADNPELYAKLSDTVIGLNDLMIEIRDIMKKSPVRNEDLIFSAIQSSNFQELKSKFELAKDYVSANAKSEGNSASSGNGWEKA